MTDQLYELREIPVTRFVGEEPEVVSSITMPRADFVAAVSEELAKYDEELESVTREDLLNVAQSMPRFPLGTWISAGRGCGCVVGEYLIARREIEESARQAFVAALGADDDGLSVSTDTVTELLMDRPDRSAIVRFGNSVDERLRAVIRDRVGYTPINSIEIV